MVGLGTYVQSLPKATKAILPPAVKAAWVIYMDGQSNNMGRGPVADLVARLQGPVDSTMTGGGNVYIWTPSDGTPLGVGEWQVLEAGVNQKGFALNSNGTLDNSDHGAELELGYLIAKKYGVDVYIIKTGRGGRPLYADGSIEDFNVNTAGELHDDFKSKVTVAEAALTEQGIAFERKGWFWMQGEYDAREGKEAYANAYEANLTAKINAVREFLGEPDLPCFVGRVRTGIVRDPELISIVQTAQDSVAASLSNVEVINTDAYPVLTDNLHYNSEGQVLFGQDYFNALTGYYAVPLAA